MNAFNNSERTFSVVAMFPKGVTSDGKVESFQTEILSFGSVEEGRTAVNNLNKKEVVLPSVQTNYCPCISAYPLDFKMEADDNEIVFTFKKGENYTVWCQKVADQLSKFNNKPSEEK